MSPYETLAADWAAKPRPRTLLEQEALHKIHGFVYCTPLFYAMGRPVKRDAPAAIIRDPEFDFTPAECDAWYVAEMAGDMRSMWAIMPWPLPFIGWCRATDPLQEVRFYPVETLKRLTGWADT